jgi:hypothetical protein
MSDQRLFWQGIVTQQIFAQGSGTHGEKNVVDRSAMTFAR